MSAETIFYLKSNDRGKDLLAFGEFNRLEVNASDDPFTQLKAFRKEVGGYLFGTLNYELKDALEDLDSTHVSPVQWPDLVFVKPEVVLERRKGGEWSTVEGESSPLLQDAFDFLDRAVPPLGQQEHVIVEQMSQEDYELRVRDILRHIQVGDIYEANFCQQFILEGLKLDPWSAFRAIDGATKAPYAAYVALDERYLMCGSPELYLARQGQRITSEPIKGTRRRGATEQEDAAIRAELRRDVKERAENIMIVDLVRNDLSRTALPRSVMVEELCRVHTFDTVHQMISRITSEVAPETDLVDIISSCFPMGSMTGAPKIRAMQIIDAQEEFRRGIYSGSVGYIAPNDDFQFNVVIRSLIYDRSLSVGAICAGGAITARSEPRAEYEESLLKVRALFKALGISFSPIQSSS